MSTFQTTTPQQDAARSRAALATIWRDFALPAEALGHLDLIEGRAGLPSSFAVGTAAQTSVAAAGLAAAEIWHRCTGDRQTVSVDMRDAELECSAYFSLDGKQRELWHKFSGLPVLDRKSVV